MGLKRLALSRRLCSGKRPTFAPEKHGVYSRFAAWRNLKIKMGILTEAFALTVFGYIFFTVIC